MNAEQAFQLERHPAYARLTLSPNLNAFHWDDVERSAVEALQAIESARKRLLLVDLSALEYLGSAQLTLLIRVWKAVKGRNGRMVVAVTTPVVREVLQTAGLQTLWDIVDSRLGAFRRLDLQDDGRARMSLAGPIVGLVALTGALAGLCVSVWPTEGFDAMMSLIVQLVCSAVALAAGLWTLIRGSGIKRGLGVGMVLASMLLVVLEVLRNPL